MIIFLVVFVGTFFGFFFLIFGDLFIGDERGEFLVVFLRFILSLFGFVFVIFGVLGRSFLDIEELFFLNIDRKDDIVFGFGRLLLFFLFFKVLMVWLFIFVGVFFFFIFVFDWGRFRVFNNNYVIFINFVDVWCFMFRIGGFVMFEFYFRIIFFFFRC